MAGDTGRPGPMGPQGLPGKFIQLNCDDTNNRKINIFFKEILIREKH